MVGVVRNPREHGVESAECREGCGFRHVTVHQPREFLGAIIRYGVRVGGTDITVDAPFVSGVGLFAEGDAVEVTLNADRALWLAD